jgi:hypothetical protein
VGSLAAYGDTSVSFDVSLDDTVKTALSSDLLVKVTSTNGCADVSIPIFAPLNVDDKPNASAIDTFDALASVWTPVGSGSVWSHDRETGLDGIWSGTAPVFTADASLTSPPLTAGPGNLSIAFSHRFSFELTPAQGVIPAQPFDGGVIEYTTNGGATWQDVTLIANPGYNNTLLTGTTNPLVGRRAYSGTNPSFPATDSITMFFGTRLAGKTFQLRFRVGTDSNIGSSGWQLDDVEFKGIVGTPFPALVADTTACSSLAGSDPGGTGGGALGGTAANPPGGDPASGTVAQAGDDAGCQVGGGAGLGGALLGAAVLLRRRRRPTGGFRAACT